MIKSRDYEGAFERSGFAHLGRGLGARSSGGGIYWTIKLSPGRHRNEYYCQADCGLLDQEAQSIAMTVWQALDPRRVALLDVEHLVVISMHAGTWLQGKDYRGPELLEWRQMPDETAVELCSRVVTECWTRGEPVWRKYLNRRDVFDLMTEADHPFIEWRCANGAASASLYLALADLLGLSLDTCIPTLTRLWNIIQNTSGLRDLSIDQLLETYTRVASRQ